MSPQVNDLPVTCTGMGLRINRLTLDGPALVTAAVEQQQEALGIWVHKLLLAGLGAEELDAAANCIEVVLGQASSAVNALHEAETLLAQVDNHPTRGKLLRLRALRRSIHRDLAAAHDGLGTAIDHHTYR